MRPIVFTNGGKKGSIWAKVVEPDLAHTKFCPVCSSQNQTICGTSWALLEVGVAWLMGFGLNDFAGQNAEDS